MTRTACGQVDSGCAASLPGRAPSVRRDDPSYVVFGSPPETESMRFGDGLVILMSLEEGPSVGLRSAAGPITLDASADFVSLVKRPVGLMARGLAPVNRRRGYGS